MQKSITNELTVTSFWLQSLIKTLCKELSSDFKHQTNFLVYEYVHNTNQDLGSLNIGSTKTLNQYTVRKKIDYLRILFNYISMNIPMSFKYLFLKDKIQKHFINLIGSETLVNNFLLSLLDKEFIFKHKPLDVYHSFCILYVYLKYINSVIVVINHNLNLSTSFSTIMLNEVSYSLGENIKDCIEFPYQLDLSMYKSKIVLTKEQVDILSELEKIKHEIFVARSNINDASDVMNTKHDLEQNSNITTSDTNNNYVIGNSIRLINIL